ncbi:DNA replication complex GINS protein sld5 [Gracilariopsis chorda]|uniref:DNA replication complex GINS protein SLD5 n=1 Tax=Gracilariopsis chorda TaxID=448386 RepID=A0A2V3IXJ8_9FLOR|nr:DNA replication complex GINS protein sld5 [Gracilariopsis chorda]|eukprot:PXF46868.1 DNA replication complex GINS protein sld5 [Gracilariopsis chorda]
MSSDSQHDNDTPRFSFGAMALSEEPSRLARAQSRLQNVASIDDAPNTSLNEAVDIMRMLARNEQYSPELLPFQTQTVSVIRSLVSQQLDIVDQEDELEENTSIESQLKRLELDRINYLLRHYYRVRIAKIENNIFFISKNAEASELLSDAEEKYAADYKRLIDDHFSKSFLSMLPQKIQVLEVDGSVDHAAGPNLDRFVFCRVRNDVGRIALGEDEGSDALNLGHGDILCVRYKGIAELLKGEDVELL